MKAMVGVVLILLIFALSVYMHSGWPSWLDRKMPLPSNAPTFVNGTMSVVKGVDETTWAVRGQYGDSMAVLNTWLTGVATIGLSITLILLLWQNEKLAEQTIIARSDMLINTYFAILAAHDKDFEYMTKRIFKIGTFDDNLKSIHQRFKNNAFGGKPYTTEDVLNVQDIFNYCEDIRMLVRFVVENKMDTYYTERLALHLSEDKIQLLRMYRNSKAKGVEFDNLLKKEYIGRDGVPKSYDFIKA